MKNLGIASAIIMIFRWREGRYKKDMKTKNKWKRSSKRIIPGYWLENEIQWKNCGPTDMWSYGSMSKANEDDLTTIIEKFLL